MATMTLVTRLIGQLSRYKHEHMLLNNLKTPCVFKRFTHTADRCCVSRALSQMVIPEAQHTEILNYWLGPGWDEPSRRFCVGLDRMKHWFMGGESVDNEIRSRFGKDLEDIAAGRLDSWQQNPTQALAGIILMDQFARNVYRGTPKAFALDPTARQWANRMLESGEGQKLPAAARTFLLLPLEHSEELADQERGVKLFKELLEEVKQNADESIPEGEAMVKYAAGGYEYAISHRDVIAKWGRFPHRNAVLGRESTPEEVKGLEDKTIPRF